MKFKRGRKKNKLIWGFILKDMPSQSLVKILFFIKTEKAKRFYPEYVSKEGETYFHGLRLAEQKTPTR